MVRGSEERRTFGAGGEERSKGVGANDPRLTPRAHDGRHVAAGGGGNCHENSTLTGSWCGGWISAGALPLPISFQPVRAEDLEPSVWRVASIGRSISGEDGSRDAATGIELDDEPFGVDGNHHAAFEPEHVHHVKFMEVCRLVCGAKEFLDFGAREADEGMSFQQVVDHAEADGLIVMCGGSGFPERGFEVHWLGDELSVQHELSDEPETDDKQEQAHGTRECGDGETFCVTIPWKPHSEAWYGETHCKFVHWS